MANSLKRIRPEELAGKVIDFLGTAEACRVFQVDGTQLSKMRSLEINGQDNHRKSPFERTGDIIRQIRIDIEDGNDEHSIAGRELLALVGSYFAQLCKGRFVPEPLVEEINGVLRKAGLEKADLGRPE